MKENREIEYNGKAYWIELGVKNGIAPDNIEDAMYIAKRPKPRLMTAHYYCCSNCGYETTRGTNEEIESDCVRCNCKMMGVCKYKEEETEDILALYNTKDELENMINTEE